MTMPNERTRALIWAGELLQELVSSDVVPAEVKAHAWTILRHYPSTAEISTMACWMAGQDHLCGPWLAPDRLAMHDERLVPVEALKGTLSRREPAELKKMDNDKQASGRKTPDESVSIDEMNATIARHGAEAGNRRQS